MLILLRFFSVLKEEQEIQLNEPFYHVHLETYRRAKI